MARNKEDPASVQLVLLHGQQFKITAKFRRVP